MYWIGKKTFQIDDMEVRYGFAKRYHILCINCAKGILFRLLTVLNVSIFLLICHLLSSIARLIKGNEGCRWTLLKKRLSFLMQWVHF